MKELLPEAEMKLQLAIYKLEESQAEKNAKNELNRRKKRQERRAQKKQEKRELRKQEKERAQKELEMRLANVSPVGSPIHEINGIKVGESLGQLEAQQIKEDSHLFSRDPDPMETIITGKKSHAEDTISHNNFVNNRNALDRPPRPPISRTRTPDVIKTESKSVTSDNISQISKNYLKELQKKRDEGY